MSKNIIESYTWENFDIYIIHLEKVSNMYSIKDSFDLLFEYFIALG